MLPVTELQTYLEEHLIKCQVRHRAAREDDRPIEADSTLGMINLIYQMLEDFYNVERPPAGPDIEPPIGDWRYFKKRRRLERIDDKIADLQRERQQIEDEAV